ncbi:hypothetical protein TorRG33x02_311130 [Trema orientale]|uniref:Uncharacterized protein n=1 Tax=Trema orientale TaxID=63057 RepID=A0A2P5BRL6_TREOI|nr:hypothetical protein TorRG33x02_311130 [Trema orientale]
MVFDVSADLLVYKRNASYPIDFRFLFFFGASPGSGMSLKQQSEMPKLGLLVNKWIQIPGNLMPPTFNPKRFDNGVSSGAYKSPHAW